jgi:glutathione peroxidase
VADVPFSEKLKGYGIAPNPEPEVLWNFEKFLISRSGQVVERFAPDTVPDAPELVAAIEGELAKS